MMLEEKYIQEYIKRHHPMTVKDQGFYMNKYGIIPKSHDGSWIGFELWKKIRLKTP